MPQPKPRYRPKPLRTQIGFSETFIENHDIRSQQSTWDATPSDALASNLLEHNWWHLLNLDDLEWAFEDRDV